MIKTRADRPCQCYVEITPLHKKNTSGGSTTNPSSSSTIRNNKNASSIDNDDESLHLGAIIFRNYYTASISIEQCGPIDYDRKENSDQHDDEM